ncbi:MutS, putative [Acanthamoeba castellanii str. Neff]|uniref:MutS, putative n=1 Tax=Acanthamoeba castellanii (strain ATCC 30010 / Neff) TaxID=1257118 RepID=L8HFN3_ACACF|nr:MutS, putative [Acanthamoeba castellanii str. Neff]ELR23236.1 MutS, putative [Acanthamoeba castellanii str. Neff]
MKEVGLAIMDLRRPELLLTQFTDSKSYSFTTSKLVLLPNTAIGSELYEAIKENFKDTDVIDVNRKYFSESYGAQTVSRLVVPENSSIEHSVSSK